MRLALRVVSCGLSILGLVWIREVTELRRRAEQDARAATVQAVKADELRTLIEELGGLVIVLEQADPAKKAELYESLGLSLVYNPEAWRVTVEAPEHVQSSFGGPTRT
jgi:hypothetical protein